MANQASSGTVGSGTVDWEQRYSATDDYVFGTAPNAFLVSQLGRLRPATNALAFADGEGRNGVWLAEQGLNVLSIDGSAAAQNKAAKLAAKRGVSLQLEQADLLNWAHPQDRFDLVVAIFIQFAGPEGRAKMFTSIKECLKPGGLLLLEGYRPEQIAYGTGGPRFVENMYTEAMLAAAFHGFEIIELKAYDAEVDEGKGHKGMSALIDLVARKPS
jgi:cyclopropane fatty-acyl-phospholipid synthase-like methyltransferase